MPTKHVIPVTPTLPAAPVLVAVAEVDVDVFEPEAEAVVEVMETVFIVPEALEVEVEVAVAPMGAVDCPLISAWTVELNVPVMPVIVNLAEKASAGN